MLINYTDGRSDLLVSKDIQPSDNIIIDKTFTLTGTNTTSGLVMPYKIGIKYTSSFSYGQLHYYIKRTTTNSNITSNLIGTASETIPGNTTETGYTTGIFIKNNTESYLELANGEFKSNTSNQTITFNLKIQFPDTGMNQDSEKGATFTGNIVVNYEDKLNNIAIGYDYLEPTETNTEPYYTFTAPKTGTYKIETWGAQGGGNNKYIGGYGGYSIGEVKLSINDKIYLYIGGAGKYCVGKGCITNGGYNGGGNCMSYNSESGTTCGSGGGSTHVATKNGLLSTLSNSLNNILIVSGAGGGANYVNSYNYASGGSGGGFEGVNSVDMGAKDFSKNSGLTATGGTQSTGYAFGTGYGDVSKPAVGAGAGFYGGKGSALNGSGGGSGYIGNTLLTNKVMYCYNCTELSETSTKTISTTCHNENPTSNCAKEGNGYAKITLISN